MNDHDERLKRLTADYNEPGAFDATDRDALWDRIQTARGNAPTDERVVRRAPRPATRRRNVLQTGVAVAAVLILGILIGRWTTTTPDQPPRVVENATERPAGNAAHRLYARDYLLRTETLLTEFRTAAMSPTPEVGDTTLPWASGLLLETRLLLDSPIADEPELTRLLRDLELILAEIVQLTQSADERERREIRQSLEDRGVMLRLRNAVPPKPGTHGA